MSNGDYDFSDLTKVNTAELSQEERAEATAQLNDTFRQTFSGGKVVGTQGIGALAAHERTKILDAVREFTDFQKGDDPYGERDFGKLKVGPHSIIWKIDCYADEKMDDGADDLLDPATVRVLTIMLAEEY